MKNLVLGIMLAIATSICSAHDGEYSIKKTCVEYRDFETNEIRCTLMGEKVEVMVAVQPQDIGKKGAFYVGAQSESGEIQFLTKNGWTDGLSAYDFYEATDSLKAQNAFTIFSWRREDPLQRSQVQEPPAQTLCSLIGQFGITVIDLWVGYGAVQADAEALIEQYNSIAVAEKPEDHFRVVYAYEDGRRNNKYEQVMNVKCGEGAPVPDWPREAAAVTSPNHPERGFYSRTFK